MREDLSMIRERIERLEWLLEELSECEGVKQEWEEFGEWMEHRGLFRTAEWALVKILGDWKRQERSGSVLKH